MRTQAQWMNCMAVAAVKDRRDHSIKHLQRHIRHNIRRRNIHSMHRNSTPIHRQVMQQIQVAARATTAYSINYTFQVDKNNKTKPKSNSEH